MQKKSSGQRRFITLLAENNSPDTAIKRLLQALSEV
jgi:hypothetical protein